MPPFCARRRARCASHYITEFLGRYTGKLESIATSLYAGQAQRNVRPTHAGTL